MPVLSPGEALPDWSPLAHVSVWGAPAGTSVENHYHDCHEYWHVLSGSARVTSGEQEYTISTGDTLATPRGEWHSVVEVLEDVSWVVISTPLEGHKRPGHLTE
jgi:mannose-6-phosphate isomerase-like protein (cupin superfamily)